MAINTYGLRYPGSGWVIERPPFDEETARKKKKKCSNGTKNSKKQSVHNQDQRNLFLQLSAGTLVSHGTLGVGQVVSKDEKGALILFEKDDEPRRLSRKTINKNVKLLNQKKSSASTRKTGNASGSPKDILNTKRSAEIIPTWIESSQVFIGCQVRNRFRKMGIITRIVDGKITVRYLVANKNEQFVYPSALTDGTLTIVERIDVESAQARQDMAVGELIKHSKP